MNTSTANATGFGQRNVAIDLLRALTMFIMVFVNDLWRVSDVPHALGHAANGEDFMGLADVVFPCFLFVVGMSIPLAIERRYSKGFSGSSTLGHILLRSLALLLMGVFIVNSEAGLSANVGYSGSVYRFLMVGAFFLIWNDYPRTASVQKQHLYFSLKITGILILFFLAITFRSAGENNSYFSARWWGILGLIGWSYLLCALTYLFTRNRLKYLIPAWLILVIISLLQSRMNEIHGGASLLSLPRPNFLNELLDILHIGNGTLPAFTMGGIIFSLLCIRYQSMPELKKTLGVVGLVVGLGIAGFITHKFWIISKLSATPPWLFYVTAIAISGYSILHYITEKGKASWFNLIKPAGTATLTTYMIPYVLYGISVTTGFSLPDWSTHGWMSIVNCCCFALITILISGLLEKIHIKLKL